MPQAKPTTMSSAQKRQPRSQGRPRLDAPAAKLSEDRRQQIRRAQKTYRLKKEACIQHHQQRVSDLEHKMAQVGEYLKEYQDMLQSELRNTHPELLKGCDRILEFLASAQGDRQMPDSSNSPHEESEVASNNETTDGTQEKSLASKRATEQYTSTQRMSPTTDSELETRHLIQSNMMIKLDQSVSDTIDRFMGGSTNYSYSFLEASFARRLKRFSLEHAFRVFTNPQSDPYEVFRLFRLVPCFRERDKMHPYFKDLVTSDRGHSLEISALPFYIIGGAGTHYPDLNGHGDPIYPPNMRVPRRILGIIPGMNGEDNSIHLDQPQQSQLQLCGFGGEWFDCRDVEGFLREKGVQITESSVFPSVKEVQNESLQDSARLKNCVLDLEMFLEGIRGSVAILGRAPGFRRSEVEAAFEAALK